jgi:hypothetical protein
MKTIIKTGIASLLFIIAMSCSKQGVKPSANALQSSKSSDAVTAFTIGQHYHGGIIFYIDGTGQHGLIAAVNDQGTGISWKKGVNVITGASGIAIGTGKDNTQKIIDSLGSTGNYAAPLCWNYKVGQYQDWYLPSKAELNLLYKKKDIVGGFDATNYWSSSEVSKSKAWDQEFGGGGQFKDSKSFTLNVHAISSF